MTSLYPPVNYPYALMTGLLCFLLQSSITLSAKHGVRVRLHRRKEEGSSSVPPQAS
jgi:hypothetical protein